MVHIKPSWATSRISYVVSLANSQNQVNKVSADLYYQEVMKYLHRKHVLIRSSEVIILLNDDCKPTFNKIYSENQILRMGYFIVSPQFNWLGTWRLLSSQFSFRAKPFKIWRRLVQDYQNFSCSESQILATRNKRLSFYYLRII